MGWQGNNNNAPRRPEGITVRVLRTIPELEEIREFWVSSCEDPNADFELYLASARLRKDFQRPHVVVVYRGADIDCILIGRLERSRWPLKVGYTTLFRPQVTKLFFVQGGFMGNKSRENTTVLIREVLQSLCRGEADVAEFSRLATDSHLYGSATTETPFVSRGHFLPVHQHRSVKLAESFEEFMRGLSRKARHELRRHEKKLNGDFAGQMHIRCYREEGELGELAQEVEKVSAKTYQRALGAGFNPEPETLESLRLAAQRHALRGCVLYLKNRPCAFFIGNEYRDTFHGRFMGFDPEYSRYSPGLMLLKHSIEDCFEAQQRVRRIDLGWGDRQYKRAICNESWQDGPIYLYPKSCRGLGLNLLRSSTSLLDLAARHLMRRSSFVQRLRKAWQAGLQRSAIQRTAGHASSSAKDPVRDALDERDLEDIVFL